MTDRDIFQRELAGELISLDDPEYPKIGAVITEAQRVIAEMNTGYREPAHIRALFARLTGAPIDPSFWLLPPFYTDFGRNIRVGRNVFVNHACEFMDRGGITIGDNVLIGPKVNLVTINHPLDPARRRSTYCAPIAIEDGAWLGAAVSVMPGVTIGRNAVVAANAVVSRDVPRNTVVGGIPARVIRDIDVQGSVVSQGPRGAMPDARHSSNRPF
jgi:acetyltransferase-like isoleucine patch superfamily enzyme